VTCIAQSLNKNKLETFTMITDNKDYDESKSAKKLTSHIGANYNEYKINNLDIENFIFNMDKIYCEPFADSSQIPTYLLSKFASFKTKSILTGDGGDEIFAGYNRYLFYKNFYKIKKIIPSWLIINFFTKFLLKKNFLNKFIWKPNEKINKVNLILNSKTPLEYYDILISQNYYNEKVFKNLQIIDYSNYINKEDQKNISFEDLMFLDQKIYLPDDILCKVDRASMANSLETRAPLIDHELIELAYKLPSNLKIDKKYGTKSILKQILKKYYPSYQLSSKKGFSIPIENYLKSFLLNWADDVLSLVNLNKHEYFHNNEVLKIWSDFKKNKYNNTFMIWKILVLQNWINKNC